MTVTVDLTQFQLIFPALWTGLWTFGILYFLLFKWIGLADKKLICFLLCVLFWYGVAVSGHTSEKCGCHGSSCGCRIPESHCCALHCE